MPDEIFISYRHLDNEAGWIDNFHERLRVRLGEFLGHRPEIWRDTKKLEGQYFADEIKDRLKEARVFISILSPGYINPSSDWCLRELRDFYSLAKFNGGVRIGNKPRIVKVVKTPVSREKYPQEFQGSNDFMFYDIDADNDKPVFFSQDPNGPLYHKYLAKVDDVALYIQGLLDTEPPPTPVVKKTVYLAETTSDLNDERDQIMRELRDRGYHVLPDEELPRMALDYQNAVREKLNLACLSIHLIGTSYGLVPEGEEDKSIIVLQNELAAERCEKPGFTRLIWIPEELQPKGERQQKFIQYLQTDTTAQKGAELLSRPLEVLKTRIIEKLITPEPPPPDPGGIDDGQLTRIYVMFDKLDSTDCRNKLRALEKYLFDKGYEVILSAPEGNDQQIFEYHKENLLNCDATLIYYGLANEFWLRSKLWEFKKAIGWGRANPMLCKAIYLAAPMTEHKQSLLTREAKVLDPPCGDGLCPKPVDPPCNNGICVKQLNTFMAEIENARNRLAKTGSEN